MNVQWNPRACQKWVFFVPAMFRSWFWHKDFPALDEEGNSTFSMGSEWPFWTAFLFQQTKDLITAQALRHSLCSVLGPVEHFLCLEGDCKDWLRHLFDGWNLGQDQSVTINIVVISPLNDGQGETRTGSWGLPRCLALARATESSGLGWLPQMGCSIVFLATPCTVVGLLNKEFVGPLQWAKFRRKPRILLR